MAGIVARVVAVLVVAVPLAFVTAILLVPVWRWLEASFGIEAIGHSGPAGWCLLLCYLGWVGAGAAALWTTGRGAGAGG